MRLGSALAVLALGLSAAAAFAQSPPAKPPAPPAATGSAAPAPAPTTAPTEAGTAEKDKDKPKTTGGYSWTDKPARRRAVRKRPAPRVRIDPKAPIATYPGFRMLPGGKSVVWVYVSRKVNVSVRRAAGRITYVLAGARVGIRNNTNPLVTHYFATPLARAWLRPDPTGAELVLELRENVQSKHRVVNGPGGTMLLRVELPRPTSSHGVSPEPLPGNARKGQIVLPAPRSRR